MGLLETIGQSFVDSITTTLRHFTAFVFVVFTIGVLVGAHVASVNPTMLLWAVITPLILALLSFISTSVAVVLFLVFAVIMLFI